MSTVIQSAQRRVAIAEVRRSRRRPYCEHPLRVAPMGASRGLLGTHDAYNSHVFAFIFKRRDKHFQRHTSGRWSRWGSAGARAVISGAEVAEDREHPLEEHEKGGEAERPDQNAGGGPCTPHRQVAVRKPTGRRPDTVRASRPSRTGGGALSRTTIVWAMDPEESHPVARQGVTRSAGKTASPRIGHAPRGQRAAVPSWRGPATVRRSRASAAGVADQSR